MHAAQKLEDVVGCQDAKIVLLSAARVTWPDGSTALLAQTDQGWQFILPCPCAQQALNPDGDPRESPLLDLYALELMRSSS